VTTDGALHGRPGDAAFAKRDYATALTAYQTADGIMHAPTTGLPWQAGKVPTARRSRDSALRGSHPQDHK
jgi:hypothetical protein